MTQNYIYTNIHLQRFIWSITFNTLAESSQGGIAKKGRTWVKYMMVPLKITQSKSGKSSEPSLHSWVQNVNLPACNQTKIAKKKRQLDQENLPPSITTLNSLKGKRLISRIGSSSSRPFWGKMSENQLENYPGFNEKHDVNGKNHDF